MISSEKTNGHRTYRTSTLLTIMFEELCVNVQDISTQAKYHGRAEESLTINVGRSATELKPKYVNKLLTSETIVINYNKCWNCCLFARAQALGRLVHSWRISSDAKQRDERRRYLRACVRVKRQPFKTFIVFSDYDVANQQFVNVIMFNDSKCCDLRCCFVGVLSCSYLNLPLLRALQENFSLYYVHNFSQLNRPKCH